jgi:hypothetical protein
LNEKDSFEYGDSRKDEQFAQVYRNEAENNKIGMTTVSRV